MSNQSEHGGPGPNKRVNPGETVKYSARFDHDIDPKTNVMAYFNRVGGPDGAEGLTWEVIISDTTATGPRELDVAGKVPTVAPGIYKLVRVDLSLGDKRKMLSNPDPDGDSSFEVVHDGGADFPNLTDFDHKT